MRYLHVLCMVADSSSGTSRDWGYGVLNAEYVYTIELRDEGEHAFELPPEQILPCSEETWAGLQAFLMFIMDSEQ